MKSLLLSIFLAICFGSVHSQETFLHDPYLNPDDSVYFKGFGYSVADYPKDALENQIEGIVYISFDLDSACMMKNVHVLKGIGFGCDEVAIQTVKKTGEKILKANLEDCDRKDLRIPIQFKLK